MTALPARNVLDGSKSPATTVAEMKAAQGQQRDYIYAYLGEDTDVQGAIECRNKVLNGDFRINQRGYVSGTATTAANQFAFDGWFIAGAGQNVSFTASGNGNLVTVPSGGFCHVIRGADIDGGIHTVSWSGTATCTVNGAAVANGGQTAALAAGANVVLKFASGTLGKVMFEKGKVATPFTQRPLALEMQRCKERYQILKMKNYTAFMGSAFGSASAVAVVRLPVAMLSAPSVVLPQAGGNPGQFFFSTPTGDSPGSAGAHAVANQTVDGFYILATGYTGTNWAAGSALALYAPTEVAIQCSAEITS